VLPKKIPKARYRATDHRDCVARLLCPKRDLFPPSHATYDRIDELAEPTLTELECRVCEGVGLPKVEGTSMRVGVVCRDALRDVPRTECPALLHNQTDYMWYRLPYFTRYLVAGRWETDDNQLKHTA